MRQIVAVVPDMLVLDRLPQPPFLGELQRRRVPQGRQVVRRVAGVRLRRVLVVVGQVRRRTVRKVRRTAAAAHRLLLASEDRLLRRRVQVFCVALVPPTNNIGHYYTYVRCCRLNGQLLFVVPEPFPHAGVVRVVVDAGAVVGAAVGRPLDLDDLPLDLRVWVVGAVSVRVFEPPLTIGRRTHERLLARVDSLVCLQLARLGELSCTFGEVACVGFFT